MSGGMRLLPWNGPDGQRCHLSTNEEGGYLSQLADDMEEVQLDTGEELLQQTAELLNGPAEASARELRFCVHRLREALRDALRVAESRGQRLA
ncbi:hypothetical protein SLV14_003829 [Streptomyces sp. Je 1-4]|uniref:hypothetical protein n=1 Tax=Streptomyces TaxID=1883 RepID=UPI0021D8B57C|nr:MULTISPECIES: hypothetical protein [unclassified Streptomyces]UYB41131.1 hypothetical protein SLV14_003829 [Streptomyces sp. Je 1-4]UZQ37301.1 hypothetical protein SLV14N_003829 [Streptomyces sp. Je 1-4] [Streptomyces sp. Je 1-4 4N24]UZQ44718.1 hypothetical protein SLV14NA_003829 [Streptomyces sp. Je 1-4] [Streptomyces sp. Je 1-4 4N24_ara]